MTNVVGAAIFCAGLTISGWLFYLQWWVHPEFTRQQMFWAYPWETAVMILLLGIGAPLMMRGWR